MGMQCSQLVLVLMVEMVLIFGCSAVGCGGVGAGANVGLGACCGAVGGGPVFGIDAADECDGVGDGDAGDGCPLRGAILAGASVDDLAGASPVVSGTSA